MGVGSASLKWSSHASEAAASYWDDASLKKAYASTTGNMDFYNVHYYDWMYNDQWGYDPMRADVAHWKLDRPVVVAEMPAKSSHYSVTDLMQKSTGNGFKGVMFWAFNDPSNPVGAAISPLKSFASDHKVTYSAILAWLRSPSQPPTPPACTDEQPAGSS